MGVRVREWKGSWWVFINHQTKRRARQIGQGPEGERLAHEVAARIYIRLAYGEDIEPPKEVPDFATYASATRPPKLPRTATVT
jgi:hypothetical protein